MKNTNLNMASTNGPERSSHPTPPSHPLALVPVRESFPQEIVPSPSHQLSAREQSRLNGFTHLVNVIGEYRVKLDESRKKGEFWYIKIKDSEGNEVSRHPLTHSMLDRLAHTAYGMYESFSANPRLLSAAGSYMKALRKQQEDESRRLAIMFDAGQDEPI